MSGVAGQRSQLGARLEARREEIEQAILTRVHSIADPLAVGSPEYVAGLRDAVSAGIRYGIAVIEAGRVAAVPVPPEVRTQARQAACNGVSLNTVLRRYVAGYTLLGDFVIREAEGSLHGDDLHGVTRLQAELFDELVDVVVTEYELGRQAKVTSLAQQRVDTVGRLLAGELVDTAALGYDLEGWHVGLVIVGADAADAVRAQAAALDRLLLFVPQSEGISWVWFGGRREPSPDDLTRLRRCPWPDHAYVAVGEPGKGPNGWRLSHRQAAAALPIALRGPRATVHYGDVALLACAIQDETLVESLHRLYLGPLRYGAAQGSDLLDTLRAYLATGGNVSSTASAIGVTRKTITTRLRVVEERLGRSLTACYAELGLALSLDQLRRDLRGTDWVGLDFTVTHIDKTSLSDRWKP